MQTNYKTNLSKTVWFEILISIMLLCSCKKLVSVDPPRNQLTAEVVFTNDESATAVMNGLYSQMMQANLTFANSALTVYPGLSADEIANTASGPDDEFSKNNLTVGNETLQASIWATGYNYIYQANAIIESLNKSAGVSTATKNQLTGEAKLLRAFCHSYLVSLFGDVPLIVTTDYRVNATLPRTAVHDVFDQSITDLEDAESLLTATYSTAGKSRPNKWTATALLARDYLYIKDYAQAEVNASAVINAGVYSLETDLNNIFLTNSNEAIWQLYPVQPGYNTWEGNIFIPGTGTLPLYMLNNSLLNSFEPADQRRLTWVGQATMNGTTYYYPNKYKIRTGASISEQETVLRLAELYLIRAEARANLNNITGAEADVNIIRNRAGLANTAANTKTDLLSAIEQERRIELFAEWGHRWIDLKRTGRADAVLGIVKAPGWQTTDALYPIPLIELQRNIFLTQNPGY